MNVSERINGLRKLIQEKCLENNEYSRILSQYESYRIKFLEDIESLMDPAHSIFSTDSDSESYDEENSESSSDASYGAPTPKKPKRSATPDQASLNSLLEKNNIVNQKNSIASQSVPQLNFPTITPPTTPISPPPTQKSPAAKKISSPAPKASQTTALSSLATTLSSLATAVSRSLSQPAPQQKSQFQSAQQTMPLSNPQNQAPAKSPLKSQSISQPINQFAFPNPNQYFQLNSLIKKLFPANTPRAKEKKPTIQNPIQNPISTSPSPQNTPVTLIEPQKPQPVSTPSNIEVVQEAEPTPAKDIKHFLYPSGVVFTQPPPKYQGTIPGHCVLNKSQNIYAVQNISTDTNEAFSAENVKTVSLISKYRKTLELLQQQQFVNLLHQLSYTQPINTEIVEMAYKLIHQNTLNWRSNTIREKLELMDLQPETKSYLKSIVKTEDENGTSLVHLHNLESKLSLWSKANTKNPEDFITQYSEVIRPNETAKLIDCIDITSLKNDEKLKQDFVFTDESDLFT